MKRHWYYFEKERWLAIERILEGHEYDSKHLNSLQPKKGTISDLILSDLTVKKTDKKDQEDQGKVVRNQMRPHKCFSHGFS